ncbi:hypothetical protein [Streptomyces sp. NPDC051218]|uniref:hypothetical protein n=1 Tax=Streptomyces sp. NPDC051218 TaxID=3365645 RepID=UPI003796663F
MSRCQSTYKGVAALERTKTAVTGQAASQIHHRGVVAALLESLPAEPLVPVLALVG